LRVVITPAVDKQCFRLIRRTQKTNPPTSGLKK
jgi:hypothetical protein